MNIYDFTAKDIDGNLVSLQDYKGKVLIVVNTASKCGFTPQYEDLQKLYDKYLVSEAPFKGFDMSNPTNKMLDAMLKDKFPEFAVGDAVKWNFTKFIIDKEGNVVNRFEPATEPMDMVSTIENLL